MTLRYLFQNPSEAELEDWVNEFGNGAWVDFAGFADLISQKWKKIDTELELRAAFRVFDRDGNGFLDAARAAGRRTTSFTNGASSARTRTTDRLSRCATTSSGTSAPPLRSATSIRTARGHCRRT